MEPKKSETSQDLAGKSEIGTLAGKSEIGFLAGKSENIGTLARTSVIASKPGAFARTVFRLTGMARSKITDELEELNRKKDVVCLILSYPPFNSRNIETHRGWIRDVLEINHEVRKKNYGKLLSDPLMKYGVSVSDLSSKITGLLHHSIHDIEAHVPSHILVEMCEDVSLWYPTPKMAMLDLCIDDFMIRQILQNIQISEIRSILISGVNDKTFPRRLKNLPPIRQMFDLVIQVNVKSCMTVEHMQDRIIEELGFSKSSRGEAEQLLRSQNFLIFLDRFDPWIMDLDLHDLGNGWWNSDNTQKIVLMGYSGFSVVPVADLEIRGSHHLLSWELFCKNVGEVMSSIQQLAVHLLRQCSGHLLATVLMARALKDVKNVRIWQHASRVIGCLPTSHAEDRILFNALAFVLEHLGSANKCVKYCASHLEMEGTYKVDLLDSWMKEDLIKTLDEGKKIVQHLVNALLLESFQNGESIRMRKEIHKELVNFYEAEMNPILLVELDGRGLMEAPKNETWEEANEMYLMNNKISKLLDNPNCPKLNALFLQGNHHLRVISPSFFQCMPILQILDLSQTKIKSLPQSLFKLVQLRKFILRSCELFSELPAEVGEFCHLEVLDLEGTEITNLPVAIGKLTNLTCLKVSFYPQANGNRKNNPSNRIIPQNVISSLLQLEELSIDVNPEDERWNATIKDIVEEVCCLNRLHFLKLHLPEVFLLNDLRNGSSLINLSRMHFRFIVGNHPKRIISRLLHESAIKFEEQESCLKYVNGKDIPIEIKEVLQHTTAFFLDRHLNATSLSEFGIENMENLKCCVLQECSEIQTIVDTDGSSKDIVLESLEYLSLHYMKNLRSIWKGPNIWRPHLESLKVLALYSCLNLTNTFTWDLVERLDNLEELVVEDCPEINTIMLPADQQNWRKRYLPNLKKISLHYLPKLVSIFGNVPIAPSLEWLSFYDCPSLKILFPEEVSSHKLKVIIGEVDWWSALNESERFQLQNLGAIFFPIERDIDLRTQLAEINDQLQAQMQKTEPSQQSGLDDSLENPAVEVETSSKQKQVA
ncbi:disease resistance protein At4g27190-like isoform X2 [Vitis riparia]|uniref:disease resistance protein At4g27190-like isoform X2 n=1 Tax=Vitis riparia TaxID=96939 RepID=UPI00155A1A9D|nr:disease resistance protein At4g27190-like isoform X2 [Vitis riparia]